MIPLYPPRQGDPNLRRLVKWRSLVHLVSHSHDETSTSHNDPTPRVRSLSTVVFFPSHRKLSSSSQKIHNTRKSSTNEERSSSLERRRPSALSLGDLRRFLPNLMRSRSSTSVVVGIEGEEGIVQTTTTVNVQKGLEVVSKHPTSQSHPIHQHENTAFGAAKNKVQRLKAFATTSNNTTSTASPKETGARPNFFKKQGRKQFGQPTVLVSVVSTTSAQSSHGLDEESSPLIGLQSDSGNAQKPKQTAIEYSSSSPKSVEKAVESKDFVAQPTSTDCIILQQDNPEEFGEQDQENPVIVVVDSSSLLPDRKCPSHLPTKGSDPLLFVNGEKAVPLEGGSSTLLTATKQRSFCSNDSQSGKKEVFEYPIVDKRLPSQTFNSTTNSNLIPKPQIFKSASKRGHLTHHPASSPVLSSYFQPSSNYKNFPYLTFKAQSPPNNHRQFKLQISKFPHRRTYPLSRSEEAKLNSGNFNRNYYPKHPPLFSSNQQNFVSSYDNSQNTKLFFQRRHSLPDMAIAAYGMVICGTDDLQNKYRGRIEKVKFGVPIAEAFVHDIPATLLVLLLKVNKEGPLKKDIWRAPGNQAQVRKLSHIMQHGRLVNISHISVYTAASVIKKFLSKLPGGIFGPENEQQLFNNMQGTSNEQQRQVFCRVICSLSTPSQHLLVLLFGTFRIIADSAETFNTRMTPDAIGISVAPSLFHTCMQDEQRAKLEDVMRFKLASQVISKIIQGFGYTNLFPRECYEFYARITGRTLRVDEHWQFSFAYPSRTFSQPSICFGTGQPISSEAEEHDEEDQPGPSGFKPKAQRDSKKEGRRRSSEAEDEDLYSEELPGPSRSSHPRRDRAASSGSAGPQLHHSGYWRHASRDPFSDLMEQRQLSTSMGEVLLHSEYERAVGESLSDRPSGHPSPYQQTMASRCVDSLESTRSLTYLEWVHEKQTKRMRTRSEWFLSPVMPQKNNGASKSFDFHSHFQHSPSPLHLQTEHLKLPETDTDISLQSSTEEMRTASSHSSSIKEQRPLSPIKIVESSLDPVVRKVEEMGVLSGETTPRLPFQLLQHHSGDNDDAPLSATPPARHQAPVFFGDDAPPAKAPKSSSSSSSGSQSQKSVLVGPSAATTGQQPASGLTRVSSIGVVRRKSWRIHYVRPNKSLDQESAPKEDLGPTSHSTPAAGSRRSSANGDNGKGEDIRLIRRKSSNSASKSKVPVQARKSTQI